MNPKIKEILELLQEECGEVIVEASKIKRFGLTTTWNGNPSHQEKLTQEVGDVMALIGLLIDYNVLTAVKIEEARKEKIEKLKQWTTIFADTTAKID